MSSSLQAQRHPERYQVELHYEGEVPAGVLLIERRYLVQSVAGARCSGSPGFHAHHFCSQRLSAAGHWHRVDVPGDPCHMRGGKGLKSGDAFWRKMLIPPHGSWAGKALEAWVY
ncbi:hypothetical protein [Pseudomonas chlororaphis]|uniref:hypothetical protein n=1 Tax=Pseudomonas chlororaphis TaxID=587753 RepID=UPI001F14FADD|nr:hypothetical protein [Pseudomonas chlororaphis]